MERLPTPWSVGVHVARVYVQTRETRRHRPTSGRNRLGGRVQKVVRLSKPAPTTFPEGSLEPYFS